jgi:hypothetical protein
MLTTHGVIRQVPEFYGAEIDLDVSRMCLKLEV